MLPFLQNAKGLSAAKVGSASLLVLMVLSDLSEPEAGECRTLSDLRQEKGSDLLLNAKALIDRPSAFFSSLLA
jgi:hypothetical protein